MSDMSKTCPKCGSWPCLSLHACRTAALPNGLKDTKDKRRVGLLPWHALMEIVKGLEFGAVKYTREIDGVMVKGEDNWKTVKGGYRLYCEAAMRHLGEALDGQTADKESGLHPLSHAGCCVLFALYFWLKGDTT